MFSDLALKPRDLITADIRRIADDEIKFGGYRIHHIHTDKTNARIELNRVLSRNSQRLIRNVGSDDFRTRQLESERHCDASRLGADIQNREGTRGLTPCSL